MKNTERRKKQNISFWVALGILTASIIVIALNVVLVYRMTVEQTIATGTQQINSLTGSLQTMLNEASYQTDNIVEEVQQMLDAGCTEEELKDYIYSQSERQYRLTEGKCFNVCFTNPKTIIVPGYEVEKDFDINTRIWYSGVKNKKDGKKYISAPYVDLATNDVCYTVAALLEDGESTVSLDFNLSEIQSIISGMKYENGTAVLVNPDGMVVSCTGDVAPGGMIKNELPEYEELYDRILSSNRIEGSLEEDGLTVFYNCTENSWYLLYIIDRSDLYHDSYMSVIRNAVMGLVLIVIIVILIVLEKRKSKQVEEALSARDRFFGNLSDELSVPIKRIMHNCNPQNIDKIKNEDRVKNIREAAFMLNGVIENMFAYSGILAADKKNAEKEKNRKLLKNDKFDRRSSAWILTVLLVLIFIITCVFSQFMLKEQALSGMGREINKYTSLLTEKMSSQFTTYQVMAESLRANPAILNDRDGATEYLKKMSEQFDDISLVYVGNAGSEQQVVMSDGWLPGPNYILQAYAWYSEALTNDGIYVLSTPFFDTDIREYCITLSGALYSQDGEFLGVLGIDFKLGAITNALENSYVPGEYAFLVTSNGTIVNHPYKAYAISTTNKQSVDELNYYKAFGIDDYEVITDYDGSLAFCMEYDDSVSGFHIVVVKSMRSLLGGMMIITIIFLIGTLLCVVLAITFMVRNTKINEAQKQNLLAAMEDAQAADDAKSRFLAMISHELRTPINAIFGMNEMILRATTDEEVIGYATDLGTSCKGLLEIVNEVLDYSKLENGKMELINVEYNMEDFLYEIDTSIEDRAKKAGLRLILEIDEELPTGLYGDETHIRQVLLNLLTNAVKYTNEGYVKLKISGKKADDEIVIITYEVEDTGIGIKNEDIERLFESFSRLDLERNRNVEGTGLGLYIVNQFLNLMNSKLEVSSVYGKGSSFSFSLIQRIVNNTPIGSYNEKKKPQYVRDDAEEDGILYAPEARILVVDDNEVNLKVACGLLKRSEAEVISALSGAECIKKLEGRRVDLILMDHMMPEMDGIETLKYIRDNKLSEAPILVMTANAISSFRDEYKRAGFDDYLAKPIVPEQFERILHKWLPKDKSFYLTKKEIQAKKEAGISDYGPFTEIEVNAFKEYAPEINFIEGLHSCGDDKDFYYEIVADYIGSKNVEEMNKALAEDNIKNYQIKVHALKSTSRSIGAAELGDEAYELEMAAKEQNKDLIMSKNSALLDHYNRLTAGLKRVLESI